MVNDDYMFELFNMYNKPLSAKESLKELNSISRKYGYENPNNPNRDAYKRNIKNQVEGYIKNISQTRIPNTSPKIVKSKSYSNSYPKYKKETSLLDDISKALNSLPKNSHNFNSKHNYSALSDSVRKTINSSHRYKKNEEFPNKRKYDYIQYKGEKTEKIVENTTKKILDGVGEGTKNLCSNVIESVKEIRNIVSGSEEKKTDAIEKAVISVGAGIAVTVFTGGNLVLGTGTTIGVSKLLGNSKNEDLDNGISSSGKTSFRESGDNFYNPKADLIKLPKSTKISLYACGLTTEELEIMVDKLKIENSPELVTYIPEKNDSLFDNGIIQDISYLNKDLDTLKRDGIIDLTRIENLKVKFDGLYNRKCGFEYEYGYFLKNIDDYAFRKMDVRDLGLDYIPEWRYQNEDINKRPGIIDIGYILIGMNNRVIPKQDIISIKRLLSEMEMKNPNPKIDLSDKSQQLKEILKKYPKLERYKKFESVIHEDHDLHTVYLVTSSIHPRGCSGYWQRLKHTGGHSIITKAREIVSNR